VHLNATHANILLILTSFVETNKIFACVEFKWTQAQ